MKLVIGEANYSTWSMRAWLFPTALNIPFEEHYVSLTPEATLSERLATFSPTRRVPVLIDGDLTIPDSLAICEYISERHAEGRGWPASVGNRAAARALVAEMHSGFSALRAEMPMNIRARRRINPSTAAMRDIRRIEEIWENRKKEPLDDLPIVDCFYAPVAMRFATYGIALSKAAQGYADTLRQHPAVVKWIEKAGAETTIVEVDEAGEAVEEA